MINVGTMKTKNTLWGNMKKQGIVLGVLIFMVLFYSIASRNFLTYANLVNILVSVSITAMFGIGMTFCIISGGYDLSMGTVMTITSVMMGTLVVNFNMPVVPSMLLTLVFGGAIGILNGFMVAKMKLPPFIATLGTMMSSKGAALLLTGGVVIYYGNDYPAFTNIVSGSILTKLFPKVNLPNAVLVLIVVAVIAHIILSKTIFGRYVYAIGSNEEAVKLSGVNVDRYKMLIYMTAGIFSSLAGFMMAARLFSVQPTMGQGYELDAIAATVLGGTPLSGGQGGVHYTVLGVLVLTVLMNGMRLLSINTNWQIVVTGVIVVIAVFVDSIKK